MALQDEVAKLVGSGSAKHKRLIEYVVAQVGQGRNLQEVLDDPYLTNRLSTLDRRALLEEPEIIDAVHEDVLAGMRAKLEAALGH